MAATALGFFVASTAHGTVIANLEFDSLPSSQGWNFFEQGPDADGETNNYTATGSTLEVRRLGGGMQFGVAGGALYTLPDPVINFAEPVYARWVTRVLGHEAIASPGPGNWGDSFAYTLHLNLDGNRLIIGINPSQVFLNETPGALPVGTDLSLFNVFDLDAINNLTAKPVFDGSFTIPP